MTTMTITNPGTKRNVKVRVWDIETNAAVRVLNADGVKGLSWSLLSQKHSVEAMERSETGDSSENNFALSIFENALYWGLGLAIRNFIVDARAIKRCPKSFKVGASRSGDVYIILPLKNGQHWVTKY